MERWKNRVAVVTGASSGIGHAIARALVNNGMTVVGMARRDDLIQELALELKDAPGSLHPIKCDLHYEDHIKTAFKWVSGSLGGVDVLVNCAGVFGESQITETTTDEWRRLLDVNVLAASICSREAVQIMRERDVDDGYIINISGVAGLSMPTLSELSFYSATQHFVRVLTEGLRRDLVANRNHIRVTCISPGLVNTGLYDKNIVFTKEYMIENNAYLDPPDIANAAIYVLSTPPHVQVQEIVIRPVGDRL